MSEPETTIPPPPDRPWFQFTLRTLFLATVVLASSLAVFGAWGIVAFILVLGLAAFLRAFWSLKAIAFLLLAVLCSMCLSMIPAIRAATEGGDKGHCYFNLKMIAFA
jgi:hypothetical protein